LDHGSRLYQPKNISDIDERLRSRFEWGLIAYIQAPDEQSLETMICLRRSRTTTP
jgi:chromosomal replication initiator protein